MSAKENEEEEEEEAITGELHNIIEKARRESTRERERNGVHAGGTDGGDWMDQNEQGQTTRTSRQPLEKKLKAKKETHIHKFTAQIT